MGRKKLSEDVKKQERIAVWLNYAERQELERRAGRLPLSEYSRSLLLKGRPPKQPPEIPAVNWAAYKELAGHAAALRAFIAAFKRHDKLSQTRAIVNHADKIIAILDRYRLSLISLQNNHHGTGSGKSDDS